MSAGAIEVQGGHELYLSSFAAFEEKLGAHSRPWVDRLRKAAIERFAALSFPTTRIEEWKYTNVAPIARTAFEPAPALPAGAIVERLEGAPFAGLDALRAVIVNGRFSRELSTLDGVPAGVAVMSLAEAFEAEPDLVQEHLARYAAFERHAFIALNTAFLFDGAFVRIPKGVVLEKPLYLLFVSSGNGRAVVSHPRTLVVAGRDTQAQIIEGYLGFGDEVYFTNAVSEAVLGEGAVIDYTKVELESGPAFHFGALQVHQARSSNFTSHSVSLGGALVRNEVGAVLGGEGAECTLNGLYVAAGQQHIDNYTTMDHAQPHCTSHEFYKGILDGKAHAVFHGRIVVRQDAQKTDAIQRNKNLLLSDDALINTKPQLEIYADDVRCTHGATVGQVDPDAVFYMRSRGIPLAEARSLLTFAFASEMLDRLKANTLRARLGEALFARLNGNQ